jgi:hypothetical protein
MATEKRKKLAVIEGPDPRDIETREEKKCIKMMKNSQFS